jgi:hypothetical protein
LQNTFRNERKEEQLARYRRGDTQLDLDLRPSKSLKRMADALAKTN